MPVLTPTPITLDPAAEVTPQACVRRADALLTEAAGQFGADRANALTGIAYEYRELAQLLLDHPSLQYDPQATTTAAAGA